jgi:hypothetical protein
MTNSKVVNYKEYILNSIGNLKSDEEVMRFIICQYGIILLAKGLVEVFKE